MILDKYLQFSLNQAITATAPSTNVVDTGTAQDVGPGWLLNIYLRVVQAFNTLTSLTITLQTATDSAFTTPVELWAHTILLAGLTANTPISVPPIPTGALRYLRLNYTVTGTAPTTGTVDASIVLDKQENKPTPAGI